MEITREMQGLKITIQLTEEELYKAHREYSINIFVEDVKDFIEKHLHIKEGFLRTNYGFDNEDFHEMATLYYNEKLNEQTESYSLAKVIIPYLEDRGVDFEETIEDFENS